MRKGKKGVGHTASRGFRLKALEDKGNRLKTEVISKTRLG